MFTNANQNALTESAANNCLFDGKYRITDTLKNTEVTALYKAIDVINCRRIVIKHFKTDNIIDTNAFKSESEKTKRPNNLIKINSVKTLNRHMNSYPKYLVMEFKEGITLEEYRRCFITESIPSDALLSILKQIANNVLGIHLLKRFIGNLDVENILIDKQNCAFILYSGIHQTGLELSVEKDIRDFGRLMSRVLYGQDIPSEKNISIDNTVTEKFIAIITKCAGDSKTKYKSIKEVSDDLEEININEEKIMKNIEMIRVQGGNFAMGNRLYHDEKPVFDAEVNDFFMGKYPVTQKEWLETMGKYPLHFNENTDRKDDNLPVEKVTWYEAIEFCNRRSEKENLTPVYEIKKDEIDSSNYSDANEDKKRWKITPNWTANGYRLPTETEWEFAARGGKSTKGYKYSGNKILEKVAKHDSFSCEINNEKKIKDYYEYVIENIMKKLDKKTYPVGKYEPNELNIYDMTGNVFEWCWDWYGSYESKRDCYGPLSGENAVLRGYSWYAVCHALRFDPLRVTSRTCAYRSATNHTYGFRVAKSV